MRAPVARESARLDARGRRRWRGKLEPTQIEDGAVGEIAVEEGPQLARDVRGIAQGAVPVQRLELGDVGEVIRPRRADLLLHRGRDDAGRDTEHAPARAAPRLLRA